MHYSVDPHSHLHMSLEILKMHKKTYRDGVNGGILLDHVMSLKHGLEFLGKFLDLSLNSNLTRRIERLLFNVEEKLQFLRHHEKDESLEQEYADLREEIKNVIIEPKTYEYDVIFPDIFNQGYVLSKISSFLYEKIRKLMTSKYKADQITPMMKVLKDIGKMLISLLEPFYGYAEQSDWPWKTKNEKEKKIFTIVENVIDKAACFTYLSFVGIMDYKMANSLKNSFSALIIEEAQIMNMYLNLDINGNFKPHISMSLRMLEWNKECYLGMVREISLEDHFLSIKDGLQFLSIILEISRDNLKLRVENLVSAVKHKLYSLLLNHRDENQMMNVEQAYTELVDEMQNVVIKPGSDSYARFFPDNLKNRFEFGIAKDFLVEKIRILVTSSCRAAQITAMMHELEQLWNKLKSLIPVFDYVQIVPYAMKEDEETKLFAALTTFLDRATCLIYLSLVGKLNEDMFSSLRNNFTLLIEETEIKERSNNLGTIFQEDLEFDICKSLSLLKMQEEYYICTKNEAVLKDHIISLKHGIEFLTWLPKIYFDRDLSRRIILTARNVKRKLESLSYEQGHEYLNMDVARTYSDLREDMRKVIINLSTDKHYCLFQKHNIAEAYLRSNSDFLLEKIRILVTSSCKADQISPMKKELHYLQRILKCLKPLCRYIGCEEKIINTLLTKTTFPIYLSFIVKMDKATVLSVKNEISAAIKETDVKGIYTKILNELLPKSDYQKTDEGLYLLENQILLFKRNVEDLNDASSKLYEVLIDVRSFLLGLSKNVILRKLDFLQSSFQSILDNSIAIFCSCYLEDTKVDVSVELNCILDQTEHVKYEVQEIKLYKFPRTDDLGFLEFFSGHLEDILKNQEISMKEEIDKLHFEVQSLLSIAKVRNQELHDAPWTDIINMAYQAEYIVDLYLVSSRPDSGLISSLSKIIEQLKNIRADVQGHCCKRLPAQDDAVTSKPQLFYMIAQVTDNDAIVGLREEANNITDHLLDGETKLDVISLVGMAGVGKTTLALVLYNTLSMADRFDILAWCTVPQRYKNRDLLLTILGQVNASDKNHITTLDDQELADHLIRSLKRRRYLIVFDDIWDTTLWDYLKRYLPDDMNCSRILITTRNRDVANQIGSKVNELDGLSEENSWELFRRKMLEKESLSYDLLKISKGIVGHCKGLPISIVIIAGILSGVERTKHKWYEIAESVNSLVLSDTKGKCRALLDLSYNHLSNPLRLCFLYLGSFPEGKEISVHRVIFLWIAEGLAQDTKAYSAEEVGKRYMDDLIAKSLVIPAQEGYRGGVKTFRLHDLLRNFCIEKAQEKHFFTLLDKRSRFQPLQDPRRIIMNGPFIEFLHFSAHSVRSMICFGYSEASEIETGIESRDMVLLEVLEVGEVLSNTFPIIFSLVHLRYLALGLLSWENSVLPSSIGKLQNLQILILRCRDMIEVPDFIWDMVKLRHINVSPLALFQEDRNKIRRSSFFLLENLRSLSKVYVSYGDSKWLRNLSGLQRVSCLFVDNDDLKDNQRQMLVFNNRLTSLKVENGTGWKPRFVGTCKLPISLRELKFSKFSLTSNDISDIGRSLPHLEVLKIYSCSVPSGYKWSVNYRDFPRLSVLKLLDLNICKWIVSENSFTSLEQLWVEKCDHLEEIPLEFGYLPKLRIISVRECAPSVDYSAREIENMQHEELNTEMRVHIYSRNYKPHTHNFNRKRSRLQ